MNDEVRSGSEAPTSDDAMDIFIGREVPHNEADMSTRIAGIEPDGRCHGRPSPTLLTLFTTHIQD